LRSSMRATPPSRIPSWNRSSGERRGWSLVDGRQETANGVGNRSGLALQL
jgi:hypothetical protein